jgi:hypothetical protein
MRKKSKLYTIISDEMKKKLGNIPFSYFGNRFLPDARGAHKEFERIESNVGRYTHGFRHYENYYNYL